MSGHAELFQLIEALVLCHSPSGVETEVDDFLRARFAKIGVDLIQDAAGNLIAHIPGQGKGALAITAHKDEIGATVTSIDADGKLKLRKLGGSFPWVYGEGIVDLIGDKATLSGVLSFGSRHVSHASPQYAFKDTAPLKWSDAWVETKRTPEQLAAAGVRVGTRVVVGRHRKAPFRINDHIASYTLDNKASLAVLVDLASRVQRPRADIYLIASSKEEIGAVGALYFSQHHRVDAMIALEVCPIAPEYSVEDGDIPVLVVEDGFSHYDEALCHSIRAAADRCSVNLQLAQLQGFGSDGGMASNHGHVARSACLGFPTQNTHGYEIAHLGAIARCTDILEAFCSDYEGAG